MKKSFGYRLKLWFSWQKSLILYLFNKLEEYNHEPSDYLMYNLGDRVITKQDEDTLRELRISLIGKEVQGYWDDGSIDMAGKGMCIDIEHRVCKEEESKFVYFIQYTNGDRNRILNAKIVDVL